MMIPTKKLEQIISMVDLSLLDQAGLFKEENSGKMNPVILARQNGLFVIAVISPKGLVHDFALYSKQPLKLSVNC